jgi:hypothetical protein
MTNRRPPRLDADGHPKGRSIVAAAVDLLRDNPAGLRYADLRRRLCAALPEVAASTIARQISDLARHDIVLRPEMGLYLLYPRTPAATAEVAAPRAPEHRFYAGFAEYLGELEGCTVAVPLGGFMLGDKWGTPEFCASLRLRYARPYAARG